MIRVNGAPLSAYVQQTKYAWKKVAKTVRPRKQYATREYKEKVIRQLCGYIRQHGRSPKYASKLGQRCYRAFKKTPYDTALLFLEFDRKNKKMMVRLGHEYPRGTCNHLVTRSVGTETPQPKHQDQNTVGTILSQRGGEEV